MVRRKYICPKCGRRTGANILYGMPIWDRVGDDVNDSYVVIGGCDWPIDGPERQCTECGHQWRISRRRPADPLALELVPEYFRFEIGGFSEGYQRLIKVILELVRKIAGIFE